jgi:hypothetical protein
LSIGLTYVPQLPRLQRYVFTHADGTALLEPVHSLNVGGRERGRWMLPPMLECHPLSCLLAGPPAPITAPIDAQIQTARTGE